MANDFLAEECRRLVRGFLHPRTDQQPPLHAQEPMTSASQPSTLEDHLLTTSVIVSCLAYEQPQRNLLRFAALIHDLPEEGRQRELERLGEEKKQVASWVEFLDEQGKALDKEEWPAMPADEAEHLLTFAHLAASRRREIDQYFGQFWSISRLVWVKNKNITEATRTALTPLIPLGQLLRGGGSTKKRGKNRIFFS